jgi:uncharacterized protein (TIGR00730 family)
MCELLPMRICVFCGSRSGLGTKYLETAREFASQLAQRSIGLVYGGASVGTMGAIADEMLARGGEVIGVIPDALVAREVAHRALSDLRVVHTMHERKGLMAELSDAFVALPGGVGTLEELFEVWSWALLGIHQKPCALLNVDGFYDPLVQMIDRAVQEGFVYPEQRARLLVECSSDQLLAQLVTQCGTNLLIREQI